MDTVIKISNLAKEYKMFARKKDRLIETVFPHIKKHGTFKAIDNLDLEVKKGEILGILGKNGAGKSTLLKMITGVVIPTSGEIEINGKISSLLELGTAFNPDLTGIENIYQHGQVMGFTDEQIRLKEKEIIEFADIGDHIHQPVKTYSSGMFARLAFACAINVEPEILIVDEVLSVGDMAFQLKCFKKFQNFKESGKTIIFVSHSIGDILDNCSRVVIIDKGKIIYDGGTKDGVEKYKKLITGMMENNIETQKIEKANENDIDYPIKDSWKQYFNVNPNVIIYGNGEAKIIDYGIFNEKNQPDTLINSDEKVSIKLKAIFNEDVECPTFSMTIKDFYGREICGTNTNWAKVYTGKCEKGKIYKCEFDQKLMLAPGKYTLSLSCSKFDYNGELVPMNRNYDVLLFEVISNKKIVGIYDIDVKVNFEKIS